MSLLSIAELRTLVNTAIDDADLQTIVDREEAEVVRLYGAHYDGSAISETHEGGGASIYLRRPVSSVSSVTERTSLSVDPDTLASDDYFLFAGQGRLVRLPQGATWGPVVVVSYVPVDDSERRKAALVELCRLTIERTAMESENVAGEYSFKAPDWDKRRATILRSLGFARA